jgi:putative ATP-dependent endonuclease of the OLD family
MNEIMIDRVVIRGYRRFNNLDLSPNAGMNVIVGDNESGKSTLLEAIGLVLTGKVNGRWAREELNPFWFNRAKPRSTDEILMPVLLFRRADK